MAAKAPANEGQINGSTQSQCGARNGGFLLFVSKLWKKDWRCVKGAYFAFKRCPPFPFLEGWQVVYHYITTKSQIILQSKSNLYLLARAYQAANSICINHHRKSHYSSKWYQPTRAYQTTTAKYILKQRIISLSGMSCHSMP